MSSLITVLFVLLQLGLVILTGIYREKLKNYSLYQVTAFNAHERAVLYNIHVKEDDMVFMNGITNEASIPMDVLVDKCCTDNFENIMQSNDIEYLKMDNKKIIFKLKDLKINFKQFSHGSIESKLTNNFLDYDAIKRWITLKEQNNIMKLLHIGETYEKRKLSVLRITKGKKKKAVFLMGGEEGKDWISPAILLNLVNYILDHKDRFDVLTTHYDFYILPLFNPDGYMYSMTKDRLWSRNTKPYFRKAICSNNASVQGISIDRNWYFNKISGKSEDCDPIFVGLKPLSEAETIAVSKFLNTISIDMMAFINVRGFENLITIPYGYDEKYCNNYDVLEDIASAVHNSVAKKYNCTFNYGLTSKYVFNFSGNVADWVKKALNTPIVYTFYIKRDSYVLPSATDIEPLTARLSTMIKETLLLANTFYGPLFNSQIKLSNKCIIWILSMYYFTKGLKKINNK